MYSYIEIWNSFTKICDQLRRHESVLGMEPRIFLDMDLTMEDVLVMAWLNNHRDRVYGMREMCSDLCIDVDTMDKIISRLLGMDFLVRRRGETDLNDNWILVCLDKMCADMEARSAAVL